MKPLGPNLRDSYYVTAAAERRRALRWHKRAAISAAQRAGTAYFNAMGDEDRRVIRGIARGQGWVSAPEAAKLTGVISWTLRVRARQRKLRAVRFEGKWFFSVASLRRRYPGRF